MNPRLCLTGISCAALLAACSANPPAPQQTGTPVAAAPAPSPAQRIAPLTLDAYKKAVAERIAQSSPDIFTEPLPDMFKSIVVLDITIDGNGNLSQVAVRRSNGFKQLETRAMDSVREAAPYAARGGAGSVRFLETFLFRDDGRFQIRSLVEGA